VARGGEIHESVQIGGINPSLQQKEAGSPVRPGRHTALDAEQKYTGMCRAYDARLEETQLDAR